MQLADVLILVIGDRVWGRGRTLNEARANAGKPRHYIAYLCEPGSYVDEAGNMCWNVKAERPVEFHRVMPKRKPR